MPAGRKPKPTALKLVTGVRRSRINQREPRPVGGPLAAPPAWLTDTQREGWDYALATAPQGLLYKIDRATLCVWIVAEDLHRQAARALDEEGLTVTNAAGAKVPSPYHAILNRQAAVMLRAASELGFTPASRSRIQVDGKEAPPIIENDDQKITARYFGRA